MTLKRIKILAFRFLIVNIVFLTVKLTMDFGDKEIDFINPQSIFYYITANILFFATWEINDYFIWKSKKQQFPNGLLGKDYTKIVSYSLVFMALLAGSLYYIGIFHLDHICVLHNGKPWLQWRIDFFRAMLIGATVIFFNVFYTAINQKKELESKVNQLKKEAVTSKYKSLKSQISPHFLFNSLNALTSLMYEDRDLASDFVTRLSSCYRYILDNREEDLVSLDKELNFLDSFMFMMNVRHEGALQIKTEINLEAHNYLIPTLTLQMLVENALKHNLFSKERPMDILVTNKGSQRLIVQNTFRKRELKEPSTQLGLKNIKKRYAFYTNQEVLVEQKNDVFTVEVPLLSKDIKEIQLINIS